MGAVRYGGWAMLGQQETLEALGRAGFDFVGLDLQHGALGVREIQQAIGLLDALGAPAYVRLAFDDRAAIPRVLDFGAAGTIVAMISSVGEVEEAVALSRYQPLGRRSYGGQRHGLRAEPDDPLDVPCETIAMIETRAALERVEEIAAVEGLAGLAIGPVDLAMAVRDGVRPGFRLAEHRTASWAEACARVRAAGAAHGLPVWTFAVDGADARALAGEGYGAVVVGSDIALLRAALARELAGARAR